MNATWIRKSAALGALPLAALALPIAAHAQGALTNGETTTGSIVPTTDVDTWTFSANVGESFVVRAGEITQSLNFQPYVRVFAPGNVLVGSSYGSYVAEVADTIAIAGTHTVQVSDAAALGATGTYRITLAKTGAAIVVAGGDEGGAMTNGTQHTGQIDMGDIDAWTIDAIAGDRLIVRMGETATPSSLNPYLRIYAPNGDGLHASYGSYTAEVTALAPATGTYLLVATDAASALAGVGGYRVTLARTGAAVTTSGGDEGGAMTNGSTHGGQVDMGDMDLWTIDATAGDALVARMGETTVGSTLSPYLRLYGPNGNLVYDSYGSYTAEVIMNSATTGTYLLVATDAASAFAGVGGYRLSMAKTGGAVVISGGDEGGPLVNAWMHAGQIDMGDLDAWTFTAGGGEAIVLRAGETTVGSSHAPYLRLYSPTGALLGSSYGAYTAEIAATATVAGTYLVVATDAASAYAGEGGYRLSLAETGAPVSIAPGDQGAALTTLQQGYIDMGDLDVWTVNATAGNSIIVTMAEAQKGVSLAPYLRIYGPNGGAALDNSYSSIYGQVSITAPVTGTYMVVATDAASAFAGVGPYWITPTNAAGVDDGVAETPRSVELALVGPNPFTNGTTLRYALPAAGPVQLRVYDAQGRVVRTLLDERSAPAGVQDAAWDGRDAGGQLAGPGLYWARLLANGRTATRKLLLAR